MDISSERIDLVEVDALVWLVEDYAARDRLLADPLYAGLDVAREGRDVFLAYEEDGPVAAATSMQTVLSLPFLLDELVPMLASAIDGDPDTR